MMKSGRFSAFLSRTLAVFAIPALAIAVPVAAHAQLPSRIGTIDSASTAVLQHSEHPLAQERWDAGRMPANTQLHGVTMYFARSAQQESALKALIAAQQTPGSAQYHQWLTPDQFAARFGMSDADLSKAESWLEQQGFTIDSVTRSRSAIHFSGAVADIERAFGTEMHYYTVEGIKHFAPATNLTLPSALSGVVVNIGNLNDFRPRAMHVPANVQHVKANYTGCCTSSSGTNFAFFAPGDIQKAYDINTSYTGTGQSLAIIGQSAIVTSDITNFQAAAGLSQKAPTVTLVPNSGTSATTEGDEGESDLDLEWSGAMAPGATQTFVYTGNNQNYGVMDALQYAVENKIGTIVSISYGGCEAFQGSTFMTEMEAVLEQAPAQGQTIIASSGDTGATSCAVFAGQKGLSATETSELTSTSVSYPASSAYVTAVGGTEMTEANATPGSGNPYWQTVSASSGVSGFLTNSLLAYVPEIVWNDTAENVSFASEDNDLSACSTDYGCLSASGGGISQSIGQPSAQTTYFTATGETNPSTQFRLVPDVALYASPNNPGFLFCTSDQSSWEQGQTASCPSSQFYQESSSGNLYYNAAGGTSFAAPIFAGELALLNQQLQYTTGQGDIKPTLYTEAAKSSTYATAFHDVTSGSNACPSSITSTYCPSTNGYSAGTGYDLATGLGSVDVAKLAAAWPASSSTAVATTTTVSASSTTPAANTAVTLSFVVASANGSGAPTGTVNITIDGGTESTSAPDAETTTCTLGTDDATAEICSVTKTFTAGGAHSIVANYAGTTDYASSTGTLTVTVSGGTGSSSGSITLAATPATLTVAQGNSGNETVSATGAGGYSGTVLLGLEADSATVTALENLCIGFSTTDNQGDGEIVIGSTNGTGTVNVILDTNASDCSTSTASASTHRMPLRQLLRKTTATSNLTMNLPKQRNLAPEGVVLAAFAVIGLVGRRSRRLRALSAMLLVTAAGFLMTACGGGGNGLTGGGSSVATTTTVTASSTTPSIGDSVTFTTKVAANSGTPTGTVNVTIDGGTESSSAPDAGTTSCTLSAGSCTFAKSFTASGTHTIAANYAGATGFNTSSGSTTITVAGGSSSNNPPKGTYTLQVVGQDATSGLMATSTSFTFVID